MTVYFSTCLDFRKRCPANEEACLDMKSYTLIVLRFFCREKERNEMTNSHNFWNELLVPR